MVTVQQLSIFLENKLGRLNEVMEIIGKSDIRIIAAMVADTSEYGILRLITSDTEKAFQVLKEHNISVNRCEVIALSTGASVGSFSQKLHPFAQEKIGIEYMYCFSVQDKAFMIIRVHDMEQAARMVDQYGLETISAGELAEL